MSASAVRISRSDLNPDGIQRIKQTVMDVARQHQPTVEPRDGFGERRRSAWHSHVLPEAGICAANPEDLQLHNESS